MAMEMAVNTTKDTALASSLMAKTHAKSSRLSSTYLAKISLGEPKMKIHMPIWRFSTNIAVLSLVKEKS